MKQFLLFGGEVYYACGGFHDFVGDYDTKEAAIEAALKEDSWGLTLQWWHVFDTQLSKVVVESERKPYGGEQDHSLLFEGTEQWNETSS